jgi:hypothetical protein
MGLAVVTTSSRAKTDLEHLSVVTSLKVVLLTTWLASVAKTSRLFGNGLNFIRVTTDMLAN